MVKVPLPSPACAREVLCAAASSLVAVLAPCSCPHPLSFLALFPPPRLGRYVVFIFALLPVFTFVASGFFGGTSRAQAGLSCSFLFSFQPARVK